MIVKIGETFFDSEDMPIMVVLSDKDKENIANMPPDLFRYCSFPEGTDTDLVKQFMQIEYPVKT
jgi:hypothetical protein